MPELSGLSGLGRVLLWAGVVLVVVGALLVYVDAATLRAWWERFPLGRLPGDISIRREGFTLYAPITSCVVVSGVAWLVLWLVRR